MNVELVTKTKGVGKYKKLNSEEIISAIARHGIIKEDNGRLVKYLMTNKHWSPLDMINFTFEIETSRSIGRHLLRHWSIHPQEHSTRYSNRIKFEEIELRKEDTVNRQSSTEIFDPEVPWVTDEFIHTTVKASELIRDHLLNSETLYKTLIESGVAKECARDILPECLKTTLSMNGTLRSWLSFLNVRMDHHTQKETLLIATEIGNILSQELPNVFKVIDWEKGMFM